MYTKPIYCIPPHPEYVAAYLWKFNVQICDKLQNVMFDETKYLLPYGSADNAIVKFVYNSCSKCPPFVRLFKKLHSVTCPVRRIALLKD